MDKTVTEGEGFTLNAVANDKESDVLTFQWTHPPGCECDILNEPELKVLHSLPVGVYEFTCTVTDSKGLSGSDSVRITVKAADVPLPQTFTLTVLITGETTDGDVYLDGVFQPGNIFELPKDAHVHPSVKKEGYVFTSTDNLHIHLTQDTTVTFTGKKVVTPPPPDPIQGGNWSDPKTWGGPLPTKDSSVTITDKTVIVDKTVDIGHIELNGTAKLVIPTGSGNRINIHKGHLHMKGQSVLEIIEPDPKKNPGITLLNINEDDFIGAIAATADTPSNEMDFVPQDRGIWLFDYARFNISGAYKTHMVKAEGSIFKGAKSFKVKQSTADWQDGDLISIAPMLKGDLLGFEERKFIKTSDPFLVTLDRPLDKDHPQFDRFTAEVLNLSHNITIGGTVTGKTHIWQMSKAKQGFKSVAIEYVGPRNSRYAEKPTQRYGLTGRYGLHWHHAGWDVKGTVIENVLIKHCGHNCFVPHGSHGMTFKNTLAYDFNGHAYWWDNKHSTHETTFDNIILAKSYPINQHISGGCKMGMGWGNKWINVTAIGVATGGSLGNNVGAAMLWQANDEGIHEILGGALIHHCGVGITFWQNSTSPHPVHGIVLFHNTHHVNNGAYVNGNTYEGLEVYGEGEFKLKANSRGSNFQIWKDIKTDCKGLQDYAWRAIHAPLDTDNPTKIQGCTFKGYNKAALEYTNDRLRPIDFINCTFEKGLDSVVFFTETANPNSIIRVQMADGTAWQYQKGQPRKSIPKFTAPFGNGNGVMLKLYSDNNFKNHAVTKQFNTLMFYQMAQELGTGLHHNVTDTNLSIDTVDSFIEFMYAEDTIFMGPPRRARITVDGIVVYDSFDGNIDNRKIVPFKNPVLGKKYPFRFEYYGNGKTGGIGVNWQSASIPKDEEGNGQNVQYTQYSFQTKETL